MNGGCRLEPDVLRAAEDDRWTDALRRHITECEECAASAAVAGWMSDFARVDDREHVLPDPAVLWLKAQVFRGSAAIDRASRPMTIVQMAAYLVVAAGWATLLTWKWNALVSWFESLQPSRFFASVTLSSADAASLSVTFVLGVLILSSMTVVLALHSILAEE